MPEPLNLHDEIKRLARGRRIRPRRNCHRHRTAEHGFFPDWIAAGHAGEMRYLEARNESGELKRASLANSAPWARSVVVCAINYNTDPPYSTHAGSTTQGWISRYAWLQRDYHDVMLPKLARA